MFTPEFRDEVRDEMLRLAEGDTRVVAAAVVGSLAHGVGDRWSDLDLSFGVEDDADIATVVEEWTEDLARRLDALPLLDLRSGDLLYRVFLLPGGLQVDLSFGPAASFGAGSPRFRLLFGQAHPRQPPAVREASDIFGWGIAYVRDGYASIERDRPWRAARCIGEVRDHAFQLACRRHGLPLTFGRGMDDLSPDVLEKFAATLVESLDRRELLRALAQATGCLLSEAVEIPDMAARAEPRVREWMTAAANVEPPRGAPAVK